MRIRRCPATVIRQGKPDPVQAFHKTRGGTSMLDIPINQNLGTGFAKAFGRYEAKPYLQVTND